MIPFDSCHFAAKSQNAPFGFVLCFRSVLVDDQRSRGSRCGQLLHIYRRVAFSFKNEQAAVFASFCSSWGEGVTQAWNSLHHSLIQVYVPRGRIISLLCSIILSCSRFWMVFLIDSTQSGPYFWISMFSIVKYFLAIGVRAVSRVSNRVEDEFGVTGAVCECVCVWGPLSRHLPHTPPPQTQTHTHTTTLSLLFVILQFFCQSVFLSDSDRVQIFTRRTYSQLGCTYTSHLPTRHFRTGQLNQATVMRFISDASHQKKKKNFIITIIAYLFNNLSSYA